MSEAMSPERACIEIIREQLRIGKDDRRKIEDITLAIKFCDKLTGSEEKK